MTHIISPELTHFQAAGQLRETLNKAGGEGNDFFMDSTEKVLANTILLTRICNEWNRPPEARLPIGSKLLIQILDDDAVCASYLETARKVGIDIPRPTATTTRQAHRAFEDNQRTLNECLRYFTKEWCRMAVNPGPRDIIRCILHAGLLPDTVPPKTDKLEGDNSFYAISRQSCIINFVAETTL